MKKLKHLMLNLTAVALIISPNISFADFKSDIIQSCSAYQQGKDKSEINPCKLYIDGFIDSSLLSEDAAMQPKAMIKKQSEPQSDFLKRAYQTRVFTAPSGLQSDATYQFCIPIEYDRKKIASTVAKSINIEKLADISLKEVLLETLITKFPCN